MCGRFTHRYKWQQLQRLLRLTTPPLEFPVRFNVAPSQMAPIIRAGKAPADRELAMLKWGLVPNFSQDGKPGPINARAESVATNGMFRAAFTKRRCIVPASGFYEWKTTLASAPGPTTKIPHYIQPAEPDGILAFAGLWEFWRKDEQSDPVVSFTIITVPPNEMMASVHDRMPAILQPEDFDTWLDPTATPEQVQELLRPAPDGVLSMHPVSRKVNSPKNDGPELIERVNDEAPSAPKPSRQKADDSPSLFD